MTADDDLHLLSVALDGRALARFAFTHGIGGFDAERGGVAPYDAGYAVHALFAALFGDLAPRPFSLREGRGTWQDGALGVLAYGSQPDEILRQRAEASAVGQARAVVDWPAFLSKPMPSLSDGSRLAFELRACPVVRRGSAAFGKKAGIELDAYLAALDRAGYTEGRSRDAPSAVGAPPRPHREETYRCWLAERLAPAAMVEESRIEGMARRPLMRRGARDTEGKRPAWLVERPDVRFRGLLRVVDATAFRTRLARGIGRHCGFGFGMLLLAPA